uniref:Leucine-rich repeat-containing N-terminal plant-type domain-containing protein n=1 Tax=Nelumbo nucifera TaxID=4432 RepID=A0A822YH15_NELNU|nr:TPA_asm: hypothetical protein HUJ06_031694 [Nelumbo nucifera]
MEWALRMRTLRAWLIVMLLLHQFHHHHHESMACLEQEKMALLAFKASVPWTDDDDTSSGRLPSWVEDDDNDDCCSWERVQCNLTTGRIIQLSLNFTRNRWSSYDDAHIPIWLLNASLFLPFQELQHLDLSENGFRGLADNEWLEPLGRLKRLEVLDLSWNAFNNSILPSLGALKSLKNLFLSGNNLEGNFPAEELAGLENLQMLDLSGNRFNGSVQAIQGTYKSSFAVPWAPSHITPNIH